MTRAAGERRRHPRRRLALTGSNAVVVTVGVVPRAALVRDLSPAGLGLLTTVAPLPDSVLPVWLPGRPGEASALALLQVIHVQPPVAGLYHIGTAGHDESSAAALSEFLARLGAEGG